ncbi:MAG: response regulator [Polyangiales bacterium]
MDLKRVLLVEDSPNDAKLTLAAFEESGLANRVVWVKDGQEALDYLQAEGAYAGHTDGMPVVVLLDLKLPKLDGLQVLEAVKRDPVLRTIPIVMLTSSNQEIDLARSYGAGANAYVVKPVGFAEFVSALRELGLFWAVVNHPPPATRPKQGA